MKKLLKLQVNPDKCLNNDELMTLKGGYGSYKCYRYGSMGGYCTNFLGYINTANCGMALAICQDVYGGGCVECW